jgi:DNA-directed RNA polymerase subunit alpha
MKEELHPQVKVVELNPTYGKFIVEPLERGFGHTLGNSLRRVLLSHIEGAAITEAHIEGALHEFDTLPGVLEDNLELLLNLRELAVRVNLPEGQVGEENGKWVLRIDVKGEREVTGADVICPPEVEILNPQHHIAQLTSPEAELRAELHVERGKGYLPAEARPRGRGTPALIPLDAAFSPIRRCAYHVEPTRVGGRTDLDRLIIELWGNGTLMPDAALRQAAMKIREYLDIFIGVEVVEVGALEVGAEAPARSRILDYPIEDLEFSVRTYNCLKKSGINTVAQLVERSAEELLAIRNFGQRSLTEVIEKLAQFGLALRQAEEERE